jgi:cation-transporting P-type ATPase E
LTELGDAKVAVPLGIAALVLFALQRRWREVAYFAAAVTGAAVFVAGLKRVLHRARPVDIYDGAAEYSFPSGHAGMSIVVFGFLAFLLACHARPLWRRWLYGLSIAFVLIIGFSRIYLGAHWLSDVLAGLAFGLAWNSVLAIGYLRCETSPLPVRPMLLALGLVFVVSGVIHVARDFPAEFARYAQPQTPPVSR